MMGYQFEIRGNRKLFRICDSDSRRVPIDPLSAEFGKLITWAAAQLPTDFGFKGFEGIQPNYHYFCDESSIIEFCKRRGITLHAHPGSCPQLSRSHIFDLLFNDEIEVAESITNDRLIRFVGLKAAVSDRNNHNTENDIDFQESRDIAFYASAQILAQLEGHLSDETHEITCLAAIPIERTFVYVDVSEFSKHSVGEQLAIIKALIAVSNEEDYWSQRQVSDVRNELCASICIGDGYIYVFRTPATATFFAACLANLIEARIAAGSLIEFHFRMSVHTGPVYRFWDRGKDPLDGKWNFIGRGITDGQRVLEAMGKQKDDVVYVSADTRKRMRVNAEDIEWLVNRGRFRDKHGEMRRLYELEHTGWVQASGLRSI
jgi:hypothetical protein